MAMVTCGIRTKVPDTGIFTDGRTADSVNYCRQISVEYGDAVR